MAKLDLASSEWCQLIFEGKNQAYGAYRMRANSPRRHTIAMLIVVAIAIVGFTIPMLLKLATPEQKEVMTEVTTLSKLAEPEIKQEEMKRVEPVAPPTPALKSSIKFTAPVIKKDEEVHEDDEIKSQEELTSTKVAISIADVKGNDEANGADIADLKQVVTQAAEPEKVFDMVEQMPTFPGGQQELMSYLGKNIKYPTGIGRYFGRRGKAGGGLCPFEAGLAFFCRRGIPSKERGGISDAGSNGTDAAGRAVAADAACFDFRFIPAAADG